jgi:hypothetical protein
LFARRGKDDLYGVVGKDKIVMDRDKDSETYGDGGVFFWQDHYFNRRFDALAAAYFDLKYLIQHHDGFVSKLEAEKLMKEIDSFVQSSYHVAISMFRHAPIPEFSMDIPLDRKVMAAAAEKFEISVSIRLESTLFEKSSKNVFENNCKTLIIRWWNRHNHFESDVGICRASPVALSQSYLIALSPLDFLVFKTFASNINFCLIIFLSKDLFN